MVVLTTEVVHSKPTPPSPEWTCIISSLLLSPVCAQDQFEQHVSADVKLNVYLYYGSDRNRSKRFLSSQDVVITTYNVLSADFGVSADGSLADRSEAASEPQCSHREEKMGGCPVIHSNELFTDSWRDNYPYIVLSE